MRPAATTTYTLFATNQAGEVSAAATVTVNAPESPPPDNNSGRVAFFAENQWKTSSASVAVDAQGGIHLAYYYYEPQDGESPTSAVYR